ncbi:MAG: YdiU family protein [Elainellaceae cyanobacterium]
MSVQLASSAIGHLPVSNPLLELSYEPAFQALGDDYSDEVAAAEFPQHSLRFRNDALLPLLGLDPQQVTDDHFVQAFGQFQERQDATGQRSPFLAMRYHGHQFGEYNPYIGDGRGFLYGQVRGVDGALYDFGTKGSGPTPYSRGGDGRLTLKGGVREVIASEALHRQGVTTCRIFSLVETGDKLWRGDEPSPTRASVMVRFSRSHIRFGTFERLHYIGRPDLARQLLDHVIETYYGHLKGDDAYAQFYDELVQRTAQMAAGWMAAGFCHAVINSDNMSITGESFDYGPYAFIPTYDPKFIAAYFDYRGRYRYENQPLACRWNLHMLQLVLKGVIPTEPMEKSLEVFELHYQQAYRQRMAHRLGLASASLSTVTELVNATVEMLHQTQVDYHGFFAGLGHHISADWRTSAEAILTALSLPDQPSVQRWVKLYRSALAQEENLAAIAAQLTQHNPKTVPVRPEIEAVWEPIVAEDDWQPFYGLLARIRDGNYS